jgi:hypothetical protein
MLRVRLDSSDDVLTVEGAFGPTSAVFYACVRTGESSVRSAVKLKQVASTKLKSLHSGHK